MWTEAELRALDKAFRDDPSFRESFRASGQENLSVADELEEQQARTATLEIDVAALQVSSPNVPKTAKQVFTTGSANGEVTLITLPLGASITLITVEVNEAFDAAASLTVGVAGENNRFVTSTDADLEFLGAYVSVPTEIFTGSTVIVANFNKSTSAVGSVEVQVSYS